MQTMTISEYLRYAIMKDVAREAEKDGIRIVAEKPRPRLATKCGQIVQLRSDEEFQND